MNRRELVATLCKLLATSLFANASVSSSMMLGALLTGELRLMLIVGTSALVASLAVGQLIAAGYIWRKADMIATRIVGETGDLSADIGLSVVDLMSLGFAVVGLTVFIPSLRSIIHDVIWFALNSSTIDDYWRNLTWRANFFSTLLEGGLGLWLLLGSRGLARGVRYLRGVEAWERATTDAEQASIQRPADAPSSET